jgi:hypothetical protein
MIADELNINKCTDHQMVTQDLHMRKVCAKMDPKPLNEGQNAGRNEVSAERLERFENEPDFFTRAITGDKTERQNYE